MEQQEERVVSFFRFEDLRVYGKAVDYAGWVMNLPIVAQTEPQRVLLKSFCRSANDIALNIAEGSSRSKSQFDHYLKIAKTAIRECVVFGELALRQGLIDQERYNQSREYLMELTRMLGALIISLQRAAERRAMRDDDEGETIVDPYASSEGLAY